MKKFLKNVIDGVAVIDEEEPEELVPDEEVLETEEIPDTNENMDTNTTRDEENNDISESEVSLSDSELGHYSFSTRSVDHTPAETSESRKPEEVKIPYADDTRPETRFDGDISFAVDPSNAALLHQGQLPVAQPNDGSSQAPVAHNHDPDTRAGRELDLSWGTSAHEEGGYRGPETSTPNRAPHPNAPAAGGVNQGGLNPAPGGANLGALNNTGGAEGGGTG